MPIVFQALVDGLAPDAVFLTVRGVEIVKANQKTAAVTGVLLLDVRYLLLRSDAEFLCGQHDRRAVSIIGTDIQTVVPARFLEAHPDISLHLFQHMSEVQRAIGIGQCAGDKNFARSRCRHGKRLRHKNGRLL